MPLSVTQHSVSWTWEMLSHKEGVGDGLLSFFCALILICWAGCISAEQTERVLGITKTSVLSKTCFIYLKSWIVLYFFNNLLEIVISTFKEEVEWKASKQMFIHFCWEKSWTYMWSSIGSCSLMTLKKEWQSQSFA